MKSRILILLLCLLSSAAYAAKVDDMALELELDEIPSQSKTATKAQAATPSPVSEAEDLLKKKDFNGVIRLLSPQTDTLPRKGLFVLARAYEGKGDSLAEVRTLELNRAKHPKDYVVLTALGQALARSRRREDAMSTFMAAKEINPRYKPVYEAMLKELEAAGEFYEARSLANDMAKRFGNDAKTHTLLCRLYMQGDYLEKTVEVCREAISKSPKTPENYIFLARTLKDKEELEQASKVIRDAAKRFPASADVHTAMGDMFLAKLDYAAAYQAFKQAAAVDPKSARAHVGHGTAAFKLQKNEEAVAAFVKACKLDRREIKEFRLAIDELKKRRDSASQIRFESAINDCTY